MARADGPAAGGQCAFQASRVTVFAALCPPCWGAVTAVNSCLPRHVQVLLLLSHRAEFLPLPRLSALEQENFDRMREELQASIQKGLDFARK